MNLYNNEGKINETNKNKFLGLFSDYIYNLLSIYNNNTREFEINNLANDNIRLQSESTNFYYLFTTRKYLLMLVITLLLLSFIYIIVYKFPTLLVEKKQNLIIFIMIILLEMYQVMTIIGPTSEKINAFDNIANNLKVNILENKRSISNVDNFDIQLVNISYETILDKFNLSIPYKQRIAIMGKIGCGKSTSVKLIMKLIKPTSGNIYFGNVDIDDININKYRSIISYIPQHIFLFDRTIEDNLFYGSILNDVEKELIIKKYKIHSFFGDDLKRKVGNNGAKLSGGQRQLLYILRHIIQPNRKVMILDEPSVSLDQNSKNYLLELLNNISDKTLIIITHDNDILKIMNRIIFLEKGKITRDKTI
jgi:ABC-type bacteriocin/lantibiotic exporter with double-glycine peptidase domain